MVTLRKLNVHAVKLKSSGTLARQNKRCLIIILQRYLFLGGWVGGGGLSDENLFLFCSQNTVRM